MKNFPIWIASLMLLALAGCVAPSTTIQTPLTARPAEREALPPHNGAIFQAGRNERPLFEDRRARNVGDILTINIVETTKADQSSSNSASHAGNLNVATPTVNHTGAQGSKTLLYPYSATANTTGSLSDKSAGTGANTFTGTITVTVIEVLPNGNLLVGGEKIVAINQGNEYIRLSGVVDPATIVNVTTGTNTGYMVNSNQVADVHLEYKGSNNNIDKSQLLGIVGRAFLSFLPF